jgi:hypothetical protein
LGLQALKMLGDEGGSCIGIGHGYQCAHLADGHPELPEAVDYLGGRHLVGAVVAVAGVLVHVSGFEQPGLVVATQRLDTQVGDLGELADGKGSGHVLECGPSRRGRVQRLPWLASKPGRTC